MRLLRGVSPCGEELWLEIMGIYLDDTDEVELLRDKATPAQRACSFLAMINLKYAEAAIVLAEQGWVLPASALLRTCVESQIRADYIIHLSQPIQDLKAKEFLQFKNLADALEIEGILNAKDGKSNPPAQA